MDSIENGQLVPVGRAAATERGDTTRSFRYESPRPGTYWRFREDFKGANTHRCRCRPMKGGTVLMLSSVELADGEPHVYHLAPHPLDIHGRGPMFHADDFLSVFEFEPNGEQIRLAEMRELMSGMDATRQLMMQDPPDVLPVGLLGHDPSGAVGEPGRELVTVDQLKSMEAYAERIRADAESRSNWITTHTETLSTQGTQLAAFHQERARAQLARATEQLEGVDRLVKMVKNLKLYTGEGIEITQLRDGEPAAADERIAIYQDVLSLDEETLILVDQGGLDHTKTEELCEALADPALLNRLIPKPRGMVLCRFRSKYKEFLKGKDLGSKIYNDRMSEESKRKLLLVRDGERLYLVDNDEVIKPITQLMPSAGEQSNYFLRRVWFNEPPEEITREDLDYAKAQREQMNALDHYGKVLIMMWGIVDKGLLFAESTLPRFANWLDEGFQRAWLDLVSHDHLIGQERPDARTWIKGHNEKLAPGSWVAIDLNKAFREEYAPGAFSKVWARSGGGDYIWAHDDKLVILRTRSDQGGVYVEVPCHYNGHRNVRTDKRNIKLYVRLAADAFHTERMPDGVLVLDRVHAGDVTYYLESRQARKDYAEYIELMRLARTFVADRDAKEAPLRQALRDAIAAARMVFDPPALEAAITEALAVARTTVRGTELPAPGSNAHKTMMRSALDLLHSALTGNEQRIAMVEAWQVQTGRKALRLARDAKRGWLLYYRPEQGDFDPRFGNTGHVCVAPIDFTGDALTLGAMEFTTLRNRKGEQVIQDWNWTQKTKEVRAGWSMEGKLERGASYWLSKEPSFKTPYAKAIELADQALKAGGSFDQIEDLAGLVNRCYRHMLYSKGGVKRLSLHVVIGIVEGRALNSAFSGPRLMVASIDALNFAYNHGGAAIKKAVVKAHDIYAHPQHTLPSTTGPLKWHLQGTSLDEVWTDTYAIDVRAYSISEDLLTGTAKKGEKRPRVLCINDAGARLFPELVKVAERPA